MARDFPGKRLGVVFQLLQKPFTEFSSVINAYALPRDGHWVAHRGVLRKKENEHLKSGREDGTEKQL